MAEYFMQFNSIWVAVLAGIVVGLATGIGALPIFFVRNIPKMVLDALLGAAAGIMLAVTAFNLIIPGIEKAGGGINGVSTVIIGMLSGGVFLDLVDKFFPNTNLLANSIPDTESIIDLTATDIGLHKAWIFTIAISVHNISEGLAVGVGFGDGDIYNGLSLAIGIGLQNIPEGLAVTLPLLRGGVAKWKVFLVALVTGLVEPLTSLIGIGIVSIFQSVLPFMLAFSAGAMLFVIAHEIMPESRKNSGHSKLAAYALIVGFVSMIFLGVLLG
jgi:ZIP family zinc transporter